jgi:cell division protein FtsN
MTYYVRVDLGEKGIWYRVYAGYFRTRKEADELIKTKKLKKPAVSRHTKYANLIGIYDSRDQLEKESKLLQRKKYSPYVIIDEGGVSYLYVGAFDQRTRAERQNAELISHGIQAKLIER